MILLHVHNKIVPFPNPYIRLKYKLNCNLKVFPKFEALLESWYSSLHESVPQQLVTFQPRVTIFSLLSIL